MHKLSQQNTSVVGRFAPTPSGQLHAGNILCALIAYLSAKSKGGKFIVRVEDLDALRCPRDAGERMLATLERLGLGGDEPPLWQSARSDVYRAKEDALRELADIYPCFCTRSQLHVATAPRLSDGGVLYDGRCRGLSAEERAEKSKTRSPCYRVAVPDTTVTFTDGLAGTVAQNLAEQCGDFILRRSDGVYAYMFAVSVDDGESGVTEVVRGRDLLLSTPRQIWLMRMLGYRVPTYCHIPLVCDCSGRKLSKSDGDDAIDTVLQKRSVPEVLGALGYAAGLLPQNRPCDLSELTALFSWDKVKRSDIRLPETLCR